MAGPGSYLIDDEERRQLLDVIESGHLTRYGDEDDPRFQRKVVQFEQELAALLGVSHCVATNSGTGSLLAVLAALDIGTGDEVIVPAYTFIASMSSVILAGARPILAEIDESLTLDPADVRRRITGKTRAIMAVHMLGNPCNMEALTQIAEETGVILFEDACQALGASYRGRRCGTIGKMGAYSLNVFKTITAGDGGAVVTDSEVLYERAFAYHDQGHKPLRLGVEIGTREIIGMNLRMNELTGAVALAQVRKLPAILDRLRRNKAVLKSCLSGVKGVGFRTINDPEECGTLLTLVFEKPDHARRFATRIDTNTLDHSGWHVYNNMEQILRREGIAPHSRPRTDDVLSRSVNISVGVVDPGLGSPTGIDISSDRASIERTGANLRAELERTA